MLLSVDQTNFFKENGYLILENFWSDVVVTSLQNRINTMVQIADLSNNNSIFTTDENKRNNHDEYFLTSGGKIRYFWEEKAWNNNQLSIDPLQGINKIGHALHDLDEEFQKVSYESRIGAICRDLGLIKPIIVQSMYIFKQAKIGGDVKPHQDGAFLYTEPQTCLGFWWPLHDCTLENGCLWVVPGSHLPGVLYHFRRCGPPKTGTEFIPSDPIKWDISQAVPLQTPKGSLVILHNAVVHFSKENLSNYPRHAYSIHVVDGKDGVVYPADNWLQRDLPFNEIPTV